MRYLLDKCYCFLRSYFSSKCSYLIFFTTSRCNARCKMCFYWREIEASAGKENLSLQEIESIAKNFRYLIYLSITGGEPALREDLSDIIYYFYKYSCTRFVTFSTNGLLPERTEKIVVSVLKRCPNISLKVYLSIDAIEDRHDEIRGVKGIFKKAIETYSRLDSLKRENRNLHVCVETVLSRYNKDEIFNIIDYVKTCIRPDVHSICLARGVTREKEAKDVTAEEYKKAIGYLKKNSPAERGLAHALLELMREVILKTLTADKKVFSCLAGKKMLTLTEEGLIVPCEMLKQIFPERDFIIGDLRNCNYDIDVVYKSQRYRDVLNFIRKSNCYCTFECAVLCNIVYNPGMYPRVLSRLF